MNEVRSSSLRGKSRAPSGSVALTGFPSAVLALLRALNINRLRVSRESGLSENGFRAMAWVAEVTSITPRGLAELLQVTSGAVTAITTTLVESGLLHRVVNPQDRRSLNLELTDEGYEMMTRVYQDFANTIDGGAFDVSAEELTQCSELLLRVAATLADPQQPGQTGNEVDGIIG